MKASSRPSVEVGSQTSQTSIDLRLPALLLGIFLGLSLLKFGNPVVLDHMVDAPTELVGFIFQPWPARWGHGLFSILLVVVVMMTKNEWQRPRNLAWTPLLWMIWQAFSTFFTIQPELSKPTLVHFSVGITCFYLGYCCLSRRNNWVSLTLPLLVGFGWVIWMGMDQHFGGLASTREEFYKQNPDVSKFPVEFIKKIHSDRIFSTLVYPNALAGAVLLFLPPLTFFVWESLRHRRRMLGLIGVAALIYGGVACLIWSGSKAGWLLALIVGAVAVLRQPIPRKLKTIGVILFLIVGTLSFGLRYRAYFDKGATSVGARFDYWRAALQNVASHPMVGSGPGTFAVVYSRLKSPESEMARLTHNDYLQQASDSGLPGMVLYLGVFPIMLWNLYQKCPFGTSGFWLWIGLLGWTLQSFVEFGLYIPALSWGAFFWLGWLLGTNVPSFDKQGGPADAVGHS